MITIKQARKNGVVFVEKDVVRSISAGPYELGKSSIVFANRGNAINHCEVISFTDRKHTGDEMPCDGDLPVIVADTFGVELHETANKIRWNSLKTSSWKPDLEALGKLANKKEDKPMAEKQCAYELVTDLTTDEIAKAMIDGEVFYSQNGSSKFRWDGKKFTNQHNISIYLDVEFYRRKEIEMITRTITYPKPVSEPLGYGDGYWLADADIKNSIEWEGDKHDKYWLSAGRIHLTKENAQAHWDALFGGNL